MEWADKQRKDSIADILADERDARLVQGRGS